MFRTNTKRTVLVNVVSQLIGRVITGGVTFFISLLIARTYGPEGFGDFAKIATYVAIFYLIADFGLNAMYIRESEKSPDDTTPLSVLLATRLLGSLLLTFICIAGLAFLPRGTSQGFTDMVRLGIILYAPTIVFQAMLTSANAYFQGKLRYSASTIAMGVGSLVTLLFVLISTKIFHPSIGILMVIVALASGSCVTAFAALGLVARNRSLALTFQLQAMAKLIMVSLPLGLALLANVVYAKVDTLLLAYFRTTAEVGWYTFAYKIFELLLVFPTFYMNAMYPLMVRSDRLGFMSIIRRSAMILAIASLVLLLITWVAAPFILLVREDFVQSITALRILALGLPMFYLSSLMMWTLIELRRSWILCIIYAGALVVNVFLNVIYIPSLGYVAASWITVLCEALVLIACSFVFFQSIREATAGKGRGDI